MLIAPHGSTPSGSRMETMWSPPQLDGLDGCDGEEGDGLDGADDGREDPPEPPGRALPRARCRAAAGRSAATTARETSGLGVPVDRSRGDVESGEGVTVVVTVVVGGCPDAEGYRFGPAPTNATVTSDVPTARTIGPATFPAPCSLALAFTFLPLR